MARRNELDAPAEELAQRFQEVEAEREEWGSAERVLLRLAERTGPIRRPLGRVSGRRIPWVLWLSGFFTASSTRGGTTRSVPYRPSVMGQTAGSAVGTAAVASTCVAAVRPGRAG
ncbi:hypothetical protein [Streptomyces sp. NPDC057253]|uniref:hypothetical protein n=1 Tax=Streptomyces sp. NPDC057253 TaxID=3346069 RepID=UPI0036393997